MKARSKFLILVAVLLPLGAVVLDDDVREKLLERASRPGTSGAGDYRCPMPEDAAVRADGPGRCPKCGMDLVPSLPPERAPEESKRQAASYYCPMHPTYRSDRPGDCPICNMALVPAGQDEDEGTVLEGDRAPIRLPPERQQLIGVRFGSVVRERATRTIRAVGRVEVNERGLAAVNLRFEGWVEKLLVKATGDPVRRGDPLLVVYSPELLEAQRNLLVALEAHGSLLTGASSDAQSFAEESLQSARERLLLRDISPAQVAEIEARGELFRELPILSKVEGVVTRRNVVEGSSIEPGRDLFEIADLSTVWVVADVYEYEFPEIRIGQEASIRLASARGETLHGEVVFVYPILNEATRSASVRIELANPDGTLLPGMYADVSISVDLGEQLLIEDTAVLDAGDRQIVFVDLGEGRLEPRDVTLGSRAGGRIVVLEGLDEGQRVVTSGNFLIDSESRLKAALLSGDSARETRSAEHEH